MSSEHPLEEQELHRVDAGEQGLTVEEKELIALRNRVRELEAFKAYVHGRLDDAGVPADPEPEANAKHGCRVEGRLNYVLALCLERAMETRVVRVPSENLGDLTGTKFGALLVKHAAKKGRRRG